jgi:hypothetical protein
MSGAGGQLREGGQERAMGSWTSCLAAHTETTSATTCHRAALFRHALSRAEAAELAAEGQLGDLQKKNADVLSKELGKATASPQIFEEDIPMKKATNKQLVTVIYY